MNEAGGRADKRRDLFETYFGGGVGRTCQRSRWEGWETGEIERDSWAPRRWPQMLCSYADRVWAASGTFGPIDYHVTYAGFQLRLEKKEETEPGDLPIVEVGEEETVQ